MNGDLNMERQGTLALSFSCIRRSDAVANGREGLDDVETIAAYSQDMSEFVKDSQRPSAGPSSRPS